MSNKSIFITTAIDYVNSLPHLGTAYEKIGADVLARYHRLAGNDTFFLMGTDEHSLNVERKATEEGISALEFCDRMSQGFQEAWKSLDISYDDFIRTSQQRHIDTVQEFFKRMHEKGDIYLGKYTGWYCVSCETFYPEKDLDENGCCPTHKKKPDWIEEDNYFFKLSSYADKLLELFEKNPKFIEPESRRNEIINVVKGGLEDISVSRASVGWGIPLPIAPEQVIYVWFDALINYCSGLGFADNKDRFNKFWPANCHIIGKDITRFHCIIWPAMLMSAGIELPEKVFGHGFVYLRGGKMSKSDGHAISPTELAAKYGSDVVRYFLMREIPFDKDGDFTWEKFFARYNSDLGNDLGNLLNRVLNMLKRYHDGKVPTPAAYTDAENAIEEQYKKAMPDYARLVESLDFGATLRLVWEIIQTANKYVEDSAPWKLAKDPDQAEYLATVMFFLTEQLRRISYLIEPFMPNIAQKIRVQLGLEDEKAQNVLADIVLEGRAQSGVQTLGPIVLFPRIDTENVD